jgi:hypothetical protein
MSAVLLWAPGSVRGWVGGVLAAGLAAYFTEAFRESPSRTLAWWGRRGTRSSIGSTAAKGDANEMVSNRPGTYRDG